MNRLNRGRMRRAYAGQSVRARTGGTWRGIAATLVIGLNGLAAGCGTAGERLPDFRYRLTVEVQTPEGLRPGASVIEVRSWRTGTVAVEPNTLRHRVDGEAVAVDLGARGTLYAVLRSDDFEGLASELPYLLIRQDVPPGTDYHGERMRRVQQLRGRLPVPRQLEMSNARFETYPILVRFRDPADPRTVQRVNPDHLAAGFGPGVALHSITLEPTQEPVTHGIRKRLPWLGDQPEPSLYGPYRPTATPTLAQLLTFGDFSRRQ